MRQKGFLSTPVLVIIGILIIVAILGAGIYFRLISKKTPSLPITQNSAQQVNLTVPVNDNSHYAIHSFINSSFSNGTKTYLFDAAKRTGKKMIRFDFSLGSAEPSEGKFSFSGLDENVKMASDRGLAILGTLGYSASWISAPGALKASKGPIDPSKYDQYVEYVKQTVAHFPQVTYWEAWNEPDIPDLYSDDPASYAKVLKLTYDAVKAINPSAKVLFGGVNYYHGSWITQVLNDPNNPGKNSIDIGNIHVRGPLASVESKTGDSLSIYKSAGIKTVWVTEFGYPAESKYQQDPNYKLGEQSQADFYKIALPKLISLGVDKVFVTLRDMGADESGCGRTGGQNSFCSEGLVTLPLKTSSSGRDKPSMAVFQSL